MAKTCKSCKKSWPETTEYFYARRDGRFMLPCRACQRERALARYYERHEEICASRRERRRTDPEWRAKNKAQLASSYKKHRERRLKEFAEYRARPEVKQRRRAYAQARWRDPERREHLREYFACYHAARKADPAENERILKASRKAWRKRRTAHLAHVRNRRARLRTVEGEHAAADIEHQHAAQQGLCFYCRADLAATGYHVDHVVPLARGGSNGPENIALACPRCNLTKRDMLPDDFRAFLQRRADRAAERRS